MSIILKTSGTLLLAIVVSIHSYSQTEYVQETVDSVFADISPGDFEKM